MNFNRQHYVGIIGTAGRGSDAEFIDSDKYHAMKEAASKLVFEIHEKSQGVTLVSGGAAVADHLAVQIFLENKDLFRLVLHLPAPLFLDSSICQFEDLKVRNYHTNPGGTANYYHRIFSKKCGVDSLSEIAKAIKAGAGMLVTRGFKERNTQVAKQTDTMIALTFGKGHTLKDGGTADTMFKFQRFHEKGVSYHVDCNDMTIYSPATVSLD